MKTGDIVQLKSPHQGRRFAGRIIKMHDNIIRTGLPNGLYVEFPEEMWELIDNKEGDDDVEV